MGFSIVPVERATTIVSVPDEVAKSLEEAWAYQQENPAHVFLASFDDETDDKGEPIEGTGAKALKLFRRQADTYLPTREGGALRFRKLRTDSLADNVMRFMLVPATAAVAADEDTPEATKK